jgi:hypothetical protein
VDHFLQTILLFIIDQTWIKVVLLSIGGLIVLILIAYLLSAKRKIISSTICSDNQQLEGDHFYYLPSADLLLNVIAVIRVGYQGTKSNIQEAKLVELRCSSLVKIRPDFQSIVSVQYHSSPFASDQIMFSNSSDGLLQNCSIEAEDRIAEIIAQAAGIISPTGREDESKREFLAPTVYYDFEMSRQFHIESKELYTGKITRNWQITIPDFQAINADLTLELDNLILALPKNRTTGYEGLITRPIVTSKALLKSNDLVAEFCIDVPSHNSLLHIPIKRSFFSKTTQIPKFYRGLLQENTITKPSEVEGLISIPIRIAKSLINVPAQLFQLRINLLNKQLQLEKESTALNQFQRQTGAVANPLTGQIRRTEHQWPPASDMQEPSAELGKLDPRASDTRDAILRKKTSEFKPTVQPPREYTWMTGEEQWNHYDNHQKKTCVPAAAAHLVQNWTTLANRPTIQIELNTVLQALTEAAPDKNPVNGCRMEDFLKNWRQVGFGGHRITNAVKINKIKDEQVLRSIIYFFGGCMIGLQMPLSAKKSNTWLYPSASPYLDSQRWGGHCIAVFGYDKHYFYGVHVGKPVTLSVNFFRQFNDELYAVISDGDWASQETATPTDPRQSLDDLNNLASSLA